jgi:hypothetical protein
MTVVKKKHAAQAIVARSKLRSATVDPAAAWPNPPPNISDSPPPFPLCRSTIPMSSNETITWMTMTTIVSSAAHPLSYSVAQIYVRRRDAT